MDYLTISTEALKLNSFQFEVIDLSIPSNPFFMSLKESIETFRILTPLLVIQDADGSINLIDGFKRLSISKSLGFKTIPCSFIDKKTGLSDQFKLYSNCNYVRLNQTDSIKCLYTQFLYDSNLTREDIASDIYPILNWPMQKDRVNLALQICKLPKDLLALAHEKKWSLKQLKRYTHFDKSILASLPLLLETFHFTSRTLEECLTHLYDHIRSSNISYENFLNSPIMTKLLSKKDEKPKKTEDFMTYLKNLRYPTIIKSNDLISKSLTQETLPKNITLKWDQSLENKCVQLHIDLTSKDDLIVSSKILAKTSFKNSIEKALSYL